MNEWNIQSRAHACEVCGQAFADKQAYHTVLFDEPPLLRRSDICEACAKKVNDQRGRAGFISQWQGTYEAPPAQPVEAIQKDTAETLLRKLVALNDPRHAPAAFILAVMLERKRLLKVKEQTHINFISLNRGANDAVESVAIDAPSKESAQLARSLIETHLKLQSKLRVAESRLQKVQTDLFSAQGEVASGMMIDFAIDPELVGLALGKKGARIKQIEQETKVHSINVTGESGESGRQRRGIGIRECDECWIYWN